MKIRDVRALPVNIPFRAPYRFSYGSIASLTKTIVILETDDGIEGLGECADGDRAADVMAMGQKLVGHDVRNINTARRRCVPAMAYTPWGDMTAIRRAFGGIEMAMWDARGKAEGRSLSSLLGGALVNEIPHTEYFSYRLAGPNEPGEASPIDVARYCERMVTDHGAQVFEGKVGTLSLAEEVDMVRAVRDAIGERELRLDANGTWSLATARRALEKFAPFDIAWFEEPCETYEELAALRANSSIAFSSHRIDLPRAVALNSPDAIVTNINEHGGIAATARFISACAEFGVGFRFHSGETGIASAAYMHMTAALDHVNGISQTLLRWYADDVIEGGPHQLENGVTPLPQGPGLGVLLDRKALDRCHARYLEEGAFAACGNNAGYGTAFAKK